MQSPNSTIQIALIGAGGMGQGDAELATSLPGVKLVAACDCYDGRLQHLKEVYGNDTFPTRDYKEIVARKDIDAVIIATPDKDLAQCVRGTRVVQLNRRTRLITDQAGVIKKFGVPPESIPDYLALVGDAADGHLRPLSPDCLVVGRPAGADGQSRMA